MLFFSSLTKNSNEIAKETVPLPPSVRKGFMKKSGLEYQGSVCVSIQSTADGEDSPEISYCKNVLVLEISTAITTKSTSRLNN